MRSPSGADHAVLLDRNADMPEGVCFLKYQKICDDRGALIPMDTPDLPFLPKRVFMVEGAEGGSVRGGHAHRSARQLMCCVAGCVVVEASHNGQSVSVELVPNGEVLLIEAGVFATQAYRSPGDRLLVLSDEPFSEQSYLD
ncbi:MAG: FdtA/QdtA family cupin domain-containing protein [Litorimonas sp.]